jgi:hypothetical protein
VAFGDKLREGKYVIAAGLENGDIQLLQFEKEHLESVA